MRTGLLIVDIQNDYFPGGAMELVGMEQAADAARKVLDSFRAADNPVFHLQHLSIRPGATFFVPDTPGVEIDRRVTPAGGEKVIQKHFPNGFRDTSLLETLRQDAIDGLVICGAMSHMCIDATTRAAFDHGFACTVLSDACATRSLQFQGEEVAAHEVHAAFMAALASPYAGVITSAELLSRAQS